MSLFRRVITILEGRQTRFAVIGASALAAQGVSRATIDLDLLVIDRGVLKAAYWCDLDASRYQVHIRLGDISDPLVGVVRIDDDDRPVDIIVGDAPWQETILEEARPALVCDLEVPVADPVGLILLKLYAGGPQDLWDIRQLLLVTPEKRELRAAVTTRIKRLPARFDSLWRQVCASVPGETMLTK